MDEAEGMPHPLSQSREHRERRSRRKRRRTLIRSIYLLPSMATLGNAVCGFAAIYVASLSFDPVIRNTPSLWDTIDPLTQWFYDSKFVIAAYLIFVAMLFDAIDGRLARFTRHTTDFGGQLDSMADVISFGVAPAIIMLQLGRSVMLSAPHAITRAMWAIGAIYACCGAVRLARFNVSNQHGEQHHYSFLGLPSPGAGGTVAALVLMQQAIVGAYTPRYMRGMQDWYTDFLFWSGTVVFWMVPVMTLLVGLLMVSTIRYPHIVNQYLKGRKSIARLIMILIIGGIVLALHKYAIAIAMLAYTFLGIGQYALAKYRHPSPTAVPAGR